MHEFTSTLVLDPLFLRELRGALAEWLERAGASTADRDSIVLATDEATAHAMLTGEQGGTVEVTASRADDESFLVHVRNDGSWEVLAEDAAHNVGRLTDLVTDVSLRSTSTLRLRKA